MSSGEGKSKAWPVDRVEELLELNELRLSASQIASRMGGGVTRNAVIGKLLRLKVPLQTSRDPNPKGPSALRRSRRRKKLLKTGTAPAAALKPAPIPPPAIDDVPRKQLLDLDAGDCRFPVGDPRQAGFGFCALPATPGASYCASHLHRCTEPPRLRARPFVQRPRVPTFAKLEEELA